MKKPTTIDEILDRLDRIIEETIEENNHLGIFAYVYRRTTARIKEAIENKRFDDNPGMEKFDVTFANYYIDAYDSYKNDKPLSDSWKAAFDAGKENLTIIQHLLLGMNAHINLDLGQTAAISAPGEKIHNIKNDFMEVNLVLNSLTDEMQRRLGKVSPLMFLLDWIGKRTDELIANFSMVKAREQAWSLAEGIASLETDSEKKARIKQADENVAFFSKIIIRPPGKVLKFILGVIGTFEEKDVKKVIKKLSE
jgi:hypothetical protein